MSQLIHYDWNYASRGTFSYNDSILSISRSQDSLLYNARYFDSFDKSLASCPIVEEPFSVQHYHVGPK